MKTEQTPEEVNALLDRRADWIAAHIRVKMQRAKIHIGALYQSIIAKAIRNGANVSAIIIQLLKYGRYRDMGVGRGYTAGSRAELGASVFALNRNELGQLHTAGRSPGRFYSISIGWAKKMIAETLMEVYGEAAVSMVEDKLSGEIKIIL